PGEAASGDAASGDAASGDSASGDSASGDSASGDAASGDGPSGDAASRRGLALPVLGSVPPAADEPARIQPAAVDDAVMSDGRLGLLELSPEENYEGLAVRRGPGVSAWVTVQRGCDHRCTYCIVPYVRGAEKNRDPDHVLAEVRAVAAEGTTEVTLLGQTVNSYRHGDWDFADLLRGVARVDGIRRVRFTSPHPRDVTARLVAVMAEESAVCRQLHLPVQAGHDRTLKRMLRRYSVAEYLEKVALVREAMPDIALSTDVIVAFPGETEEEFEATLDLMRQVRFDDAFLYRYSPRDGTPATRLPTEQFLPDAVAAERLERLIALHRSIQRELNVAEVGRTVQVLVERSARSAGDMLGRTESYKAVAFPGEGRLVGQYVDVRLVSTTGATFKGEPAARSAQGRVA
ncbi:MAG: MiaB/RimO family radical SAM methylthiotransferase, partial [Gemmatimonadota bacterium]